MKSKTSAALLLVSIFLLGGVAGGVTHYIYQNHFVSSAPQRPRMPNRHDIVEEMAQSLNLDARQKEQLRVIWQQSRERFNALSVQYRPQYEKLRAETNEAIRAILRPDQRQHFDDTLEKMDSRHRDHTHDPTPPQQSNPSK
ncbi:MAG: periplasmic heavy metal sensor [Acidobacteriia bacterium]|nr:periplasmic heavy metal sensor [Terriglobia bacterium]